MTIASLIVDVLANTVKLETDVKKIQSSLDSVGDAAKKLGGVLAGAFGVASVGAAVKSFLDASGALTDLSAKTGISTTELQKLKYAAEQNGGTLEGVTTAITKMGRSLVEGDTGTVNAMKRLGLSITDVRNMSPGDAFATIADKLAEIKNPMEQATLGYQIFGKGFEQISPMINGSLNETMKAAEKLGIVLDEKTVAAGDNLGDTLTALQGVGTAVIGKMLAPMLPAFQMVATAMLGAGNVVDYLRLGFDALLRVALLTFKGIVDGAIYIGELAQKIPGLSRVLGDDAAAMQGLRDASTWLAGAIAGVEKGTDDVVVATKKAVPPVQTLTKAQQDQANAAEAVRKAAIPLTEAQKLAAIANEKLGISAETTGKQLGISAAAVSTFLDSIKNGKEISEIWRKAHETMTDASEKFIRKAVADWQDGQQKMADASARAITAQLVEYQEFKEKNYQLTLSGTALTVRQIELERDARITALKTQSSVRGVVYDKDLAEIEAYYRKQIDIANGSADTIVERMRQQGVFTRDDLAKTAERARADYEAMVASSGLWSKGAIENQKRVAEAAEAAARGTKTSWEMAYDAFGNVSDILSLIPGKVGEIGTIAAQAGQAIVKNLADGNVWGAIVAGATAVVKIFSKLFGSEGRDEVEKFAKTFADATDAGGFDNLHAKLLTLGAAGEQLWIKLTQGVGKNNPEQAKAVIEEINKALASQDAWMQRLPGLIEKYGLSWEQAGQQAKQARLDEIARGLIQDFADLSKAGFDVTLITEKMSVAINDYVKQAMLTGTEIPAAMKPLLQKMIDLGLLTDAAGNKMDDLGGLTFSTTLTEGFKSVVDAIKELTKALTGDLGGALDALGRKKIVIPIEFEDKTGGKGRDSESAAMGGVVGFGRVIPFASGGLVNFRPIGTDTVPAMLTPGEIVLNAAHQRNLAGAIGGGARQELQALRRDLADQREAAAADRAFLLVQVPKAIASAVAKARAS